MFDIEFRDHLGKHVIVFSKTGAYRTQREAQKECKRLNEELRASQAAEFLTRPVHAIQHDLAAMVRQNTGKIPRGQLWQPCEAPGCDREPVCMNCMCCEEVHCHCFD